MNHKICTRCKIEKNFAEFNKDKAAKDGLCFMCKDCKNERQREGYLKSKLLAGPRIRKDKTKCSEYTRRYREKNPEKVKEGRLAYDAKRKQKKAIQDAARYAKNREAAAARYAAWVAANPESVRVRAANRRARKKGAGGKHTQDDILLLLKLQQSKCAACKCCIKNGYEVDHITPIAKNGANDRLNLQLLCSSCNRTKHAKDPIDFMQIKGYLL